MTQRSAARGLIAVLLLATAPARADGPHETHTRGVHFSATVGWYGALGGLLPHGPAATLEVFPGGVFGRFGAALQYRGLERIDHGAFTLGLAFEAGASRPRLALVWHAEIGYESAHSMPLLGAGLRAQLGGVGPLVVASDLAAQVFVDGVDSRLAVALTLSAGLGQ